MSSSSSPADRKDEAPAAKKAAAPKPEWTVGHLHSAFGALNTIASEKLEPRASAKILKLVEWIRPFYDEVVDKCRAEATRLGTPAKEGEVTIEPENIEEFNSAMRKVTAEKVSIPSSVKLSIEDLTGARISPVTLNSISCIMSDL